MANPEKRYCLGFLVDRGYVVLVRKNRPDWQKGLLNGVGGHIEAGETGAQAMIREFREETGLQVDQWKQFCIMSGDGWKVECFWATGPLSKCKTTTDEEIEIISINDVFQWHTYKQCIENIPWLLSMIESQKRDSVDYYTVNYVRPAAPSAAGEESRMPSPEEVADQWVSYDKRKRYPPAVVHSMILSAIRERDQQHTKSVAEAASHLRTALARPIHDYVLLGAVEAALKRMEGK